MDRIQGTLQRATTPKKRKLPADSLLRLSTWCWLIIRNLEEFKPRNTASRDYKLLPKGVAPRLRMPHREPVPIRQTNDRHAKRRNGMRLPGKKRQRQVNETGSRQKA